jgi:dimethylargininase
VCRAFVLAGLSPSPEADRAEHERAAAAKNQTARVIAQKHCRENLAYHAVLPEPVELQHRNQNQTPMTLFKHAIVRPPATNFADGLTSVNLGKPVLTKALEQHARYCEALQRCGLELIHLEADARFPDSTFVEDTAVLTPRAAILTRPGAHSRAGEVVGTERALRRVYSRFRAITAPGTVDGGDVCEADGHFFIGLSERTNEQGAGQLAGFLEEEGFTSALIDIRGVGGILHLKSGISYLGDNRLVLIDALIGHAAFKDYEIVRVVPEENYAANFLRINAHVIVSAGHPQFESTVRGFGYPVIALDMSEFEKMDGALSCLSLRY